MGCSRDIDVRLSAIISKLESFQDGPQACAQTASALGHLREALGLIRERTARRVALGIKGTSRTEADVLRAQAMALAAEDAALAAGEKAVLEGRVLSARQVAVMDAAMRDGKRSEEYRNKLGVLLAQASRENLLPK